MNKVITKRRSFKKGLTIFEAIIVIFCILAFLWFVLPISRSPRRTIARRVLCQLNLKQLGMSMKKYAGDISGDYPPHDKWCDLIKPYFGRDAEIIMRCPAVKEGKCHYAMNPNCDPNSPPDTVLLFETKGGWNLSGGPELLATEKHSGSGCNILFNNGSVDYVQKEEIPKLKWNAEEKK